MGRWDAVEAAHLTLDLINSVVLEVRYVENVLRTKSVGVGDAIGHDPGIDPRLQCLLLLASGMSLA